LIFKNIQLYKNHSNQIQANLKYILYYTILFSAKFATFQGTTSHAARPSRAGSPHSLSNKETQMEFLSAFNTCYFRNQRRKSRLSFKAVDLLAAHRSTSNILYRESERLMAAVPQSACVNSI